MKKSAMNYLRLVQLLCSIFMTELLFLAVLPEEKPLPDIQCLLGVMAVTLMFLFYLLSRFHQRRNRAGGFHLS